MATCSAYCAGDSELESVGSDEEVYSGRDSQNVREQLEDSSSGTFCFQRLARTVLFMPQNTATAMKTMMMMSATAAVRVLLKRT